MTDPRSKGDAPAAPKSEPPPTVRPPFDPEEYARQTESRIRVETQKVSARPTVAPPAPSDPVLLPTNRPLPTIDEIGLDAVPALAVAREDLEWFELAPFARELLVHVDGVTSLRTLCDRGRLPADRVLETFRDLAHDGVVTLGQ